jgi:hypothetical protein
VAEGDEETDLRGGLDILSTPHHMVRMAPNIQQTS